MSGAVSTIRSGGLEAQIAHFGAELVSLKDGEGREFMYDGDPAVWTGRAPLLFPMVGRLNNGQYRHAGHSYAMDTHGFARRSTFTLVSQTGSSVLFRLTSNAETRASYPFAFELDMQFELDGLTLKMRATVRNPGEETLPFSFGYHPAFAWPLPGGGEKLEHRIIFAEDEPADIRRLDTNGVIVRSEASPVADKTFALHPDQFVEDAMIWDELASRELVYQSPGGPALEIAFGNLPMLGIWQKPGANYICIEPWAGIADDAGFTGEFSEKRGIMSLLPGAARHFTMDVTLRPR
ncbi:aldose 1-epimerase family protein [Aurantiacibacter marinus]|uniref:Aldose epimerase n=1 Tax=Aurantiacibacter marinus TaxID=874156 RepID=A0A0H0XS89_9SPHN|nr:aldose 1-epimerase family protein [Aurantiacibacter marinus]KLI64836.1 aldose epimerase [Aurantiacibacter marinus]